MVFPVMGLKINWGFSAFCKHCHPSSSSCHRAALAIQASESDENPSPISNLNSPGILRTSALPSPALTSSEGVTSGCANSKRCQGRS